MTRRPASGSRDTLVEKKNVTLAPASTAKVLTEQIAYLIVHEADCSIRDCPDCERMRTIRLTLLSPFRTIPYAWARNQAKAAA